MKYIIYKYGDWGYPYFALYLCGEQVMYRNSYDMKFTPSIKTFNHIVWHRETGEIISQQDALKIILILYGVNRTDLLPPSLK